jgi:hypothetical protein
MVTKAREVRLKSKERKVLEALPGTEPGAARREAGAEAVQTPYHETLIPGSRVQTH